MDTIFPILQGLYGSLQKQGLTYVVTPGENSVCLLLFQRAVYFLTNPYQAATLSDQTCHLLERLAQYMEAAGNGGFEWKNWSTRK